MGRNPQSVHIQRLALITAIRWRRCWPQGAAFSLAGSTPLLRFVDRRRAVHRDMPLSTTSAVLHPSGCANVSWRLRCRRISQTLSGEKVCAGPLSLHNARDDPARPGVIRQRNGRGITSWVMLITRWRSFCPSLKVNPITAPFPVSAAPDG